MDCDRDGFPSFCGSLEVSKRILYIGQAETDPGEILPKPFTMEPASREAVEHVAIALGVTFIAHSIGDVADENVGFRRDGHKLRWFLQ